MYVIIRKRRNIMDFFETVAGRNFTEDTVPTLISEIRRLSEAVEESNRLKKEELKLHMTKDGDE